MLCQCFVFTGIRVPFQLHGEHTVLQPFLRIEHSVHTVLPSLSYRVHILTWVKWSIWEWSALQHRKNVEHRNNISRLRGEKHDISLKILHQVGFKSTRQTATLAKRNALTISPFPSLTRFSAGTVFIRQNLTYKDDPRAERIKIVRIAVDP